MSTRLARHPHVMPQVTGASGNFLEGSVLKRQVEDLFYGSSTVVAMTVPLSISATAVETLDSDVAMTVGGFSINSFAIESFPPDVAVFLSPVISASASIAMPPADVAMAVPLVISSQASEALPPGAVAMTLSPEIAISATHLIPDSQGAADLTIYPTIVAAADVVPNAESDVAMELGGFAITVNATHGITSVSSDVACYVPLRISGTCLVGDAEVVVAALTTSVVSALRLETGPVGMVALETQVAGVRLSTKVES